MSGRFIVLEGIDGSGKGTQLALLAERLTKAGHSVWLTREPTDGAIGRLIREGLGDAARFDEATIALLFAADRLAHIAEIRQHLAAGEIVLCDRYVLSSLAYNSQTLTLEWILALNEQADARLHPDLTLYFDLSEQLAMSRIDARGDVHERYETQRQLYQVREMYRMLADVRIADNVHTIDAKETPEIIAENAWQAVQNIL